MSRVLAYVSNQADRLRCALALDGPAWAPPVDGAPRDDGWGAGSYQQGEVLLRRRPVEGAVPPAPAFAFAELRTDSAMLHVRATDMGLRSPENTPPFRFRDWLFALQGPALAPRDGARVRSAIVARVPSFLVQSVQGDTLDEAVFGLFLGAMYARGQLDNPDVDRSVVAACCGEALRGADEACAANGVAALAMNLVATNRRVLIAHRRGPAVAWHRRHGIRDCAACRRPADVGGTGPRVMDHEHLKCLFVLGDGRVPERWAELPVGATLTSDLAVEVRVLES